MLITINIDPTEYPEGAGVGLLCDSDYAEYVSVVDVVAALERLTQTLKIEVSKQVVKGLTAPPVPGEAFNAKCKAVTIKDLMLSGLDLTPPKKN